jgi:inositol oxygenase
MDTKETDKYRNYQNEENPEKMQIIYNTYKLQRTNINYAFNSYLIEKYATKFTKKSNFWAVFALLDGITDLSDPDTSLPNSIHALQVAEAIRLSGKYEEWMPLVGLIHDMGKVLYIDGCDADGTSKTTQWALVGDTFITGAPLPETLILPELNATNTDNIDGINVYCDGCGLDKCSVAFGHDEYMWRVMRRNGHKMPRAAEYIVRYHSLYAWHSSSAYDWLQNDEDKKMKRVVQEFNKFDLYTKNDSLPVKWTPELKEIYTALVRKYISPTLEIYW